MIIAQQIKSGMTVNDSEGRLIGTVDHVDEDGVGLAREGFADDLHHFVSLAAVLKVDGDTVIDEPGQATTIEAVEGAILYARRRSPRALPLFGTSGHGTGSGGSGFGS